MGAPLALNGELGPPRFRRIVAEYVLYVSMLNLQPRQLSYAAQFGLLAVVRSGLPDVRPGLRSMLEDFGISSSFVRRGKEEGRVVHRHSANGLFFGSFSQYVQREICRECFFI